MILSEATLISLSPASGKSRRGRRTRSLTVRNPEPRPRRDILSVRNHVPSPRWHILTVSDHGWAAGRGFQMGEMMVFTGQKRVISSNNI